MSTQSRSAPRRAALYSPFFNRKETHRAQRKKSSARVGAGFKPALLDPTRRREAAKERISPRPLAGEGWGRGRRGAIYRALCNRKERIERKEKSHHSARREAHRSLVSTANRDGSISREDAKPRRNVKPPFQRGLSSQCLRVRQNGGRDARAPFFSAYSAPPRENKQGAINRAPTL